MIKHVVTRGYGNGVFSASKPSIPTRGYGNFITSARAIFKGMFRGMFKGMDIF